MDLMNRWEDWRNIHQPFELAYHRDYGVNWCSDDARFWEFWDAILDFVRVPEQGTIVDIGCGPRPPLQRYAETHDVHVLDPLLSDYLQLTPGAWWEGLTVYTRPGETPIPVKNADLVMSWNCLDHTIGWKDILTNVHNYLKPGGVFVCATDFQPPHVGHPGFKQEDFENALSSLFEIQETKEHFQEREKAYRLIKKEL